MCLNEWFGIELKRMRASFLAVDVDG
jgi:hypothetical protein